MTALDAADNAIYELLRPDSVDGIIVVSSLLSTYCGASGVARLVARLGPATLCSIGIELPGVPSLVLDNRPGMEAVVEHLIREAIPLHIESLRAHGDPVPPPSTVATAVIPAPAA